MNDESLEADQIVIAVGGRPATLGIDGEEHLTRSDEFMNLKSLPTRVVFIGGGYISMEFAHVARRAGSDVTVIDRGERILKQFDEMIIEHVEKHAESIGINLIKSANLKSIKRLDGEELSIELERNGDC